MIKKIINQSKRYIVFLFIAMYTGSSIAQDVSAIHGSLVVGAGEIRFDQGNVQFGTVSIADGFIIGTARQVPSYMSFMGSAVWQGVSATSYVDGYVRSYKSGAFTFPIGDNGVYRPAAVSSASLSQPIDAAYYHADPSTATTTSIFGVGVMELVLPASGPFPTSLRQAVVKTIDSTGYWHIKGSQATKISLSWLPSTSVASFTSNDLQNLTIVGWKNNQWQDISAKVDTNSILGGSSSFISGSITTTGNIVPSDYVVFALGSKLKKLITIIVVSNSDTKTIGPAANSDPNIDFTISGPFHGSGIASIGSKTGLVSFIPVVPAFVGRDTIYKIRCTLVGSVTVCDTVLRIVIEGRPNRGTPVSDSVEFNTGKTLADLPPISTGGKPYTTSTSSSAGSTVSVDANGKVNYTPRIGFTGADTVRANRCVDGVCDVVTYIINVKPPLNVEIPNYFSPNGDGMNDVWNLDNLLARYPNAKALVYNRWGNIVWRSTGPYGMSTSGRNLWYGQVEGSQDNAPDGVYYYLLDLEDDFKTSKTGFIELMRN